MSQLLELIKKTLIEKQAENITVINMKEVNPYADYFVVCTAKNTRHAGNMVDYLKQDAAQAGFDMRTVEGDRNSTWILADFNEVVVHIFTEEARKQYKIEALWADQPQETIVEPEIQI